ncbi:MAG: BON domain-containing protein [Alphaproteobacteria bacterium]|nr:BON domain-containing protein [Alphaproteobacteria bacterium]
MKNLFPLLSIGAVLALPACTFTGVATGLGATAGVAAAQEGGISRALSDARIQTQINDLWFRYDIDMFRKLDMTVKEGRVLVTGVVQNPEHRVEAIRLAWQPEGVKQVINEVRVADSNGIVGFAKDAWISARLRSALIFDKQVQSINYNIDTVQGSIYLMGFALSQSELNRVIELARTVPGARQVVSYVKIVGADSGASTPYDDTGAGGQGATPPPIADSQNDSGTYSNGNAGYNDQYGSSSSYGAEPSYDTGNTDGNSSDPWGESNNPSAPVQLVPYSSSSSSSSTGNRQGIEAEDLLWNDKQ